MVLMGQLMLYYHLTMAASGAVFGLETSLQREFGDYLQFRKNFNDPDALAIQTSDWVNTLGVYTEFAWKTR